jgi:23S rRNA (cytidine1920-2'-O)/16S rRNA (cytidine1409-2'-O)-methyltransferase
MERTNARLPFPLPEAVDLIVADVSFISLRLVLPPSLEHLRAGNRALVLVKPQFEAGRHLVARGGVVKDPTVHAEVVGSFCNWAIGQELRMRGVRASALEGERGNREFFVLLQKPA